MEILKARRFKSRKVNFLAYGPDQPYFKQEQKNNITKCWPDFFKSVIFCFSSVFAMQNDIF